MRVTANAPGQRDGAARGTRGMRAQLGRSSLQAALQLEQEESGLVRVEPNTPPPHCGEQKAVRVW